MADGIAEQMTGVTEHPNGVGQFYDSNGKAVTHEEAQDLFIGGDSIEVPNAGAGSYDPVFRAMGYQEVKAIEWGSSAGDWIFGIRDEATWYVAYQTNRYPQHGYAYSLNGMSFETYEEACSFVS